MPDKKESFASRWSRRKQQVSEEEKNQNITEETLKEVEVTEAVVDPEQLKAEKQEAINQLTDEDMPDIETLDEHSDFSGFMSTRVSETLRNMALKKLFMGKSYNIRDGLDEYDGDYTKFEKMPKSMITSDMKHMVEVEARKKLEKEKEKARQRMIASGEIDEFEEIDEFDEFADDDDESNVAEAEEEYIDEYINVEGFDTTVTNQEVSGGFENITIVDSNNTSENDITKNIDKV